MWGIVAVVVIASKKHPVSVTAPLLRWIDRVIKRVDPLVAGGGEACKLLIKRKGIVVLALLFLVVSQMEAAPRAYVAWDPFVQHFQRQFQGPITQEKLDEMTLLLEEGGMDAYDQNGLRTVLEDAMAAPEGAWIVHSATYEAVWNDNVENYQRDTGAVAILFLVLLLSPIASQERQSSMVALLNSTCGGRERLMKKIQLLVLGLKVLVWVMVYGTELCLIIKEHGSFNALMAPAESLELLRTSGWSVPLWVVLALFYLWRLLVLVAVAEVCFCLSSHCQKDRDAMLLCGGVVVIPAALAAIGSAVGEYFSFLLPLGGAEILHIIFS